ncbi:sphingomyelin phosphodiesterase [Streptomyces cacaoi]|uniref:sphingomyelin phosphodiesterase n=1 Tax=Streptomyces cacaoi TaxID=1898 RepID=UPI003747AC2B
MRVLTHNTMLLSQVPLVAETQWDQTERAQLIGAADYLRGHDVVVLEEMFSVAPADHILQALGDAGYEHRTPVIGRGEDGWDATHGSYAAWKPENGGVAIASRWPIRQKQQFIYGQGCGTDRLANKGFVYVALDVDGTQTHVVGTHTQSDDEGCGSTRPCEVRLAQVRQLHAFLEFLSIPTTESVIVAGDFNIDASSSEFEDLLKEGHLDAADQAAGWPYSFDTQDNGVASYRYPHDPRQRLDHVLLRTGHARPGPRWNNTVLRPRSSQWQAQDRTFTDYSDHYPVVGGDV